MALIYDTTMHPTKFEMLAAWLPQQPWFTGDVAQLEALGAYRFDDPEGEVGMEGHLVTAGDGKVYHVPVTYRGAAFEGGEEFLLDTSAHGVLGTRWISDAIGDPVYRDVLARVIAEGGRQVEEVGVNEAGEQYERQVLTRVRGSGEPGGIAPAFTDATVVDDGVASVARNGAAQLSVLRVLDTSGQGPEEREASLTLRATWPGQVLPVVVATLTAGE